MDKIVIVSGCNDIVKIPKKSKKRPKKTEKDRKYHKMIKKKSVF